MEALDGFFHTILFLHLSGNFLSGNLGFRREEVADCGCERGGGERFVVDWGRAGSGCCDHVAPEWLAGNGELWVLGVGGGDGGEGNLLAKERNDGCRTAIQQATSCSTSAAVMYYCCYVLEEPF